ncbi:MAG: hypothetical protein QM496_21750 [Verrucomicrobiota bacterium]
MWRYIISYVAVALLSSALLVVLVPKVGFIEDLAMMGFGIVAIFLLGNEVFLHALLPTKEETGGIDKLLKRSPQWEWYLIFTGAVAGLIGVMAFFIVARRIDSILPAIIPIAAFAIPFILLQYVIPRMMNVKLLGSIPTLELMELWGYDEKVSFIGQDDDAWLAEEASIPVLKEFVLRDDILSSKRREIISALTLRVMSYHDEDLGGDEETLKSIIDDLDEFFKNNRELILRNTDGLALDCDAYLHWLLGDPYVTEDLPNWVGERFGKGLLGKTGR